jgi:hypothetical protein
MDEKMDLKGFNIDSTNEISIVYNHIVWCNHVGFDVFFRKLNDDLQSAHRDVFQIR